MGAAVLLARAGFKTPTTEDFVWPCLTPHWRVGGADLCINRTVGLTFFTLKRRSIHGQTSAPAW
jgi:hypothetical protein